MVQNAENFTITKTNINLVGSRQIGYKICETSDWQKIISLMREHKQFTLQKDVKTYEGILYGYGLELERSKRCIRDKTKQGA